MKTTEALERRTTGADTLANINRPAEHNKLAKLNMRELKELATVFIESGSFTDVKQTAQAMVKILAGQELGFSPIVSMTGIHFFNGKVAIGANLIASLIKDSGKYEYKITEHTADACSVLFYQKINNELKQLGVPVRYTIADAAKAGLMVKDNWKKFPMDMLFAACIRQGSRRYCADVLRGVTGETDVDINETINTAAMDEAAAVPAITTPEAEPVDAEESKRVDLVTAIQDLAGEPFDEEALAEMTIEQLEELYRSLSGT